MYKKVLLQIVLSLLVAAPVWAVECNDEHTVDTCFDTIGTDTAGNTPKFEALAADAIVDRNRALSIATTGDVSLNAFGSEVSLNDFLSQFNIAVDPGTGPDDAEQVLLEYSPTEGWFGGDLKLSMAATRAKLPDPIKTAINDATLVSALENEFTLADDVTLSLGYSYMGRIGGLWFGRSAKTHQDLLNAVVNEANKKTVRDSNDKLFLINLQSNLKKAYGVLPARSFGHARTKIAEVIEKASAGNGPEFDLFLARFTANQDLAPVHSPCLKTLEKFDFADTEIKVSSVRVANCIVDNLVALVTTESRAEIDSVSQFRQELADNGFFKISELINNQSQLIVSANVRSRDDLAGGNKYGLKVAMEWDASGHNVSNLNKYLNAQCWPDRMISPTVQDYQSCSASIADYIAENPVKTGGWRVSTSLEFAKSEALDLMFPGSTAIYKEDEAKTLSFSVVGGRQYGLLSQSGLPKAKLDIGATYEDVSGDPMRQDRAMANITFTQELAQAMQLSIGLVWANKAEYRGDADSDLSARLGLNYKFGPAQPDAQ